MTDEELLALHREIVAVRSVSGEEGALRDFIAGRLSAAGVEPVCIGDNLVALSGSGSRVCLNSHLDTVPPCPGWSRDPLRPEVEGGRVYGLGSNDAKASVAAMLAAFLRLRSGPAPGGGGVMLAFTVQEEVGGRGAEVLVPELAARGLTPAAVVVGEPTGLDIAVAQKGLLILELRGAGRACHAAHGRALGAPNAIRKLARDLVALDAIDLGPDHPELGPVTIEPTLVTGGTARNAVPAEASCILDVRTNPTEASGRLLGRMQAVVQGDLRVVSDRLVPCEIEPAHPLVQVAREARPEARTFGSRSLSDLVFFAGTPGIKVGPGSTERSHTADEFVYEREIVAGAAFYERLVRAWCARRDTGVAG